MTAALEDYLKAIYQLQKSDSCRHSKINAGHSGAEVSPISTPLRAAKYEADEFALYFDIDYTEDGDELYLIRLIRK
jgi:hypothetical protein